MSEEDFRFNPDIGGTLYNALTVYHFTILFVGILTNSVTLITLFQPNVILLEEKGRIFMENIVAASICKCFVSVLVIAMTFTKHHWSFGLFGCRILGRLNEILSILSTIIVLAMMIYAYLIDLHPSHQSSLSRGRCRLINIGIWLISIFGMILFNAMTSAEPQFNAMGGYCEPVIKEGLSSQSVRLALYITVFAVGIGLILILSLTLSCLKSTIYHHDTVITEIYTGLVFGLCWIPHTVQVILTAMNIQTLLYLGILSVPIMELYIVIVPGLIFYNNQQFRRYIKNCAFNLEKTSLFRIPSSSSSIER